MYQHITVKVKVQSVSSMNMTGGKSTQQVTVGDESGSCLVTLWEKDVNASENNRSYHLCGILISQFGYKKFLPMARYDSIFEPIENIGDVCIITGISDDESRSTFKSQGQTIT